MPEPDDSGPSADGGDLWASVANERTALAWNRTAVSLAAAGAAIIKAFSPLGIHRPRPLLGLCMIALAAAIWLTGQWRYRRARESILAGRITTPPELIRAFAIAMSAVTVTAFVLAIFPR